MNRIWRDRLLRLTVAGIELSALYTIISLVNYRAVNGVLFIPAVLVIYIVSLGFNRLFFIRKLNSLIDYPVNVLLWFVSTQFIIKLLVFPSLSMVDPVFLFSVPNAIVNYAAGFRPEFVIFLCSLFLWPLGFRLARVKVGFVVSLAEFQCGLAIILFTYFLNSQIGAGTLNSIPAALAFVALSIIALALSHAEQQSSWLSGRHSAFWLTLLGVIIVLIIFFGFVAGTLANHDFLDILLTPVRWLWWLFSQFMLFLAEHTVMEKYLNPLDWAGGGASGGEDAADIFKGFQMPLWLRDGLRFGLGVVWLLFILYALWRISSLIFQWLRSHFVSRYPAEVESLDGSLKDDLLNLLRRLWGWLMRPFRRTGVPPDSSEVESVRQLYRDVLAWGAAKGVRRSSEQTPYEYLFALSEAIPPAAIDLRVITDRYVGTRYGSISPGRDELTELRLTWQRIKRNGDLHK
jgi:hypothetical protein